MRRGGTLCNAPITAWSSMVGEDIGRVRFRPTRRETVPARTDSRTRAHRLSPIATGRQAAREWGDSRQHRAYARCVGLTRFDSRVTPHDQAAEGNGTSLVGNSDVTSPGKPMGKLGTDLGCHVFGQGQRCVEGPVRAVYVLATFRPSLEGAVSNNRVPAALSRRHGRRGRHAISEKSEAWKYCEYPRARGEHSMRSYPPTRVER